jgi:hypothetical protein
MLTAGYAVWVLASVEVIAFRVVWCFTALLGVAVLSYVLQRALRGSAQSAPTHRWRPDRFVIGAEAVFWGVFALFLSFA